MIFRDSIDYAGKNIIFRYKYNTINVDVNTFVQKLIISCSINYYEMISCKPHPWHDNVLSDEIASTCYWLKFFEMDAYSITAYKISRVR